MCYFSQYQKVTCVLLKSIPESDLCVTLVNTRKWFVCYFSQYQKVICVLLKSIPESDVCVTLVNTRKWFVCYKSIPEKKVWYLIVFRWKTENIESQRFSVKILNYKNKSNNLKACFFNTVYLFCWIPIVLEFDDEMSHFKHFISGDFCELLMYPIPSSK